MSSDFRIRALQIGKDYPITQVNTKGMLTYVGRSVDFSHRIHVSDELANRSLQLPYRTIIEGG
jgi:hypothetical protein